MRQFILITRKQALKILIGAAAFFGFETGARPLIPQHDMGTKNKSASPSRRAPEGARQPTQLVAVQPCLSYDDAAVYGAVSSALRAIDFTPVRGQRVLLKPNIMAQNTPEQAASTHPAVVGALCRIFTESGCSVSIGDSSAFYQGGCTREGLATTGMAAVAERYGAALIPFETTTLRRITTKRYLNPLYITDAVFEHDLVVNLPKLKVHRLARYSGAVKNLYGCVVGGTKQLYHRQYQDRPDYREFWGGPLVDVYEAVNPALTVMDAVVGLDEDGPAATGTPRQTGLVLASGSAPALDLVACRIIGFDPMWVPALREAIRRGHTSPERAAALSSIPLPSVPYRQLPDEPPATGIMRTLDHYFFDRIIVQPRISRSRCSRCGDCVEKCAAGAISISRGGYPSVNLPSCIRCYCCAEYCAAGAVTMSGGVINHLIRAVRQIKRL